MRLFLIINLAVLLCSSPSWAQDDNFTSATSALQNVLSTLKESVQQLTLDNEQLVARDKDMKDQVFQLQTQLGQLQQQENDLNKKAETLQDKSPSRDLQLNQLQEESDDLDDRIKKAEDSIQSVQQDLEGGYQENQSLLLQLKGIQDLKLQPSVEVKPPESKAEALRQIEKLKLLKMIYASQQRQALLNQAILGHQKNTPLLSATTALAHPPNHWDDAQLRQLESELKDLEQNYLQFKGLLEQMDQKTHKDMLTASQHAEEEKLQSSIDDLSHQSIGLRVDLDDLRSQMVDLDKRKSRLEVLIQQLP